MRAPIIAAGVAALALAGWLLHPPGGRGQTGTIAAAAREEQADEKLTAMNEKLESLERAMARQQSRRDAPQPTTAATAAETDDEPPPEDAREAAEQRPPAPVSVDEIFQGLEGRLAHEGADAEWSSRAEAGIADAFRTEALAGSTLVVARCRATFCRVDVEHDSALTQHAFLQQARAVPPFVHGGVARPVGDSAPGPSKTVMYIAREGHPLPGG